MIKLKKIKPMFTSLITTMDKYEEDGKVGTLYDPTKRQGTLKEYQTVLAVGDSVRGVQEGDLVCINPARYAVKKYEEGSMKDNVITENTVVKYNFNIVELDGVECLLLDNNDIRYVITEFEEIEEPKVYEAKSDLIIPDTKLIV